MARSFHLTVFFGWITLLIALECQPASGADVSNTTTNIITSDSYQVNGGNASGAGSNTANNNTVFVRNGSSLAMGLVGGNASSTDSSASATTNGNKINMISGSVGGQTYGGNAHSVQGSAQASGNIVTLTDGILNLTMGGGIAASLSNSAGDTASASGNQVVVNGGTVSGPIFGGYASSGGGASTSNASGNSVFVNGGVITQYVKGGYAYSGSAPVSSTNNEVNLSAGSVDSIYGGDTFSMSGVATSTGNTVTISGGSVSGNVYGGQADSTTGSATATGNRVIISGGSVGGSVYGAYVKSMPGIATGNTVVIIGSPTFGASTQLAGGDGAIAGIDYFSGNSLNVEGYTGGSVASVKNFQYFNFLLPASFSTGSSAALSITGPLSLTNGTKSSSIESVNFQGGGAALQPGNTYTLLRAGSITGVLANNGQTITGRQGAALLYRFLLAQNAAANTITATVATAAASGVNAAAVNPQMKAVSEGHASGSAVVNQGADLVAGQGMASAVTAVRGPAQGSKAAPGTGLAIGSFGAMSAGSSTYHTGSHVDVSGFSLAAGVAAGAKTACGYLTAGPFFEFGSAAYNTYNSFDNAASVSGNGNTRYMGGGLLGRMDFADMGPGHFYAEASARAGSVHNKYNNDNLQDGFGRSAGFSTDVPYYGLHAGSGYVWDILQSLSLDTYAKYFWTRQEANSFTLSTGDSVDYKAADSNRLRLGSRMTYALNDYVSPYAGAAFEREFNGKVEATTYGQSITAPSMRGNTGIGELGLNYRPSPAIPFTLDLGVQGYTGKREGVTGSLQAKYEF